jgi:hypothetical protein
MHLNFFFCYFHLQIRIWILQKGWGFITYGTKIPKIMNQDMQIAMSSEVEGILLNSFNLLVFNSMMKWNLIINHMMMM